MIGELTFYYRVTAIAIVLLIVATAFSHARRTRAVGMLTLLLPAYIAAIEACRHLSWLGRTHPFTEMPTLGELREQFLMSAAASGIAILVSLAAAACLLAWCRAGIAGRISWRVLSALPPLASIALLWFGTYRVFFP